MRDKIRDIVYSAIQEIEGELNIEVFKNLDEETVVFENLDSMAVLDLILEIEDGLQKEFGRYIQIADEKSMDVNLTPFRSVGSTIDMIYRKVQDG